MTVDTSGFDASSYNFIGIPFSMFMNTNGVPDDRRHGAFGIVVDAWMAKPLSSQINITGNRQRQARFILSQKLPSSAVPSGHENQSSGTAL